MSFSASWNRNESPSKGLRANQAASPPPWFSFTQWCSGTRLLLLISGDSSSLSCPSYEDPSSLHVKWIHSGFGEVGGMGMLLLFLHIYISSVTRLKRGSSSQCSRSPSCSTPRTDLPAREHWKEMLSIALNLGSDLGQDRPWDFHSKAFPA